MDNCEVQMAVGCCCAPSLGCAGLGCPEEGSEGPPSIPTCHSVQEFCSLSPKMAYSMGLQQLSKAELIAVLDLRSR